LNSEILPNLAATNRRTKMAKGLPYLKQAIANPAQSSDPKLVQKW